MSMTVKAFAFLKSRADEKWEKMLALPRGHWSDFVKKSQDAGTMDAVPSIAELLKELTNERPSRRVVIKLLTKIDLLLGSHVVELEDVDLADDYFRFMFKTFVPEVAEKHLDEPLAIGTADFVRLFERLSVEKVEAAAKAAPPEVAETLDVKNLLKLAWQVRPLVKECKTSGARLIWMVNEMFYDEMLNARAEQHIAKLGGVIF